MAEEPLEGRTTENPFIVEVRDHKAMFHNTGHYNIIIAHKNNHQTVHIHAHVFQLWWNQGTELS